VAGGGIYSTFSLTGLPAMINLPLTRCHQPWLDIMGDLITYFLWGKTDIVGSLSEIFCAIFAGLIDVDWLSSQFSEYSGVFLAGDRHHWIRFSSSNKVIGFSVPEHQQKNSFK
jgi:hypothetical protein